MTGKKVKYTCKNCNWQTSIRAEWADLRPKRCMNKRCNTSFLKSPDALLIELPIEETSEKKTKKSKKAEEATQAGEVKGEN